MADKPKHTPGPWELEDDGGIRAGCGGCVAFVQPHGNVNTIHREGESFSSADGRLIAAAPDLYRELKHLVRLLEPLEHVTGLEVPGLATLNGARLALAKATAPKSVDAGGQNG